MFSISIFCCIYLTFNNIYYYIILFSRFPFHKLVLRYLLTWPTWHKEALLYGARFEKSTRIVRPTATTQKTNIYCCIMQNLLVLACQECQHTAWYYANCLPIAFQWRIEAQTHTRTQLLTYKLLQFTAGGLIGVLPAVVVLMFCFHSHQKPTVKCVLFGIFFLHSFLSVYGGQNVLTTLYLYI